MRCNASTVSAIVAAGTVYIMSLFNHVAKANHFLFPTARCIGISVKNHQVDQYHTPQRAEDRFDAEKPPVRARQAVVCDEFVTS